jgi:hypothetical protein
MSLESFVQDFERLTEPNPLASVERVYERMVGFEVKPFGGAIRLSCIRSFDRGKGHAKQALSWFLALADKHGVAITGHVKPIGSTSPRLTSAQLRAWYKRHGFTVSRSGEMRREPTR